MDRKKIENHKKWATNGKNKETNKKKEKGREKEREKKKEKEKRESALSHRRALAVTCAAPKALGRQLAHKDCGQLKKKKESSSSRKPRLPATLNHKFIKKR